MSEWVNTTLGDILIEADDRNSDGAVNVVLSVTEGRGIIPQTDVFKKRIATENTSKYKIVRPLDIAWNPYLLWTGAVGQWLGGGPGVTSPVYPVFRAKEGQEARYWGLVLESGLLTPYFNSTAVGSIQRRRRTTLAVFKAAVVQVPSLAEQRRIVDVMATVNAQIEALTAEVESSQRVATLLRADVPDADEAPLSGILQGIDSGRSVQTRGEAPRTGDARVLKLSAVRPGRFNAEEAKRLDDLTGYSDSHLVAEGDLLVTRANTPERVGYVAVARSVPERTYMPDLIWRARVNPEVVTADYLGHLLSSTPFRARITATAGGTSTSMVKINKKGFGALRVPVPSIEKQEEYVTKCDAASHATADVQSELVELRAFRSTFLSSMLNQDIEIPESYDAVLAVGLGAVS